MTDTKKYINRIMGDKKSKNSEFNIEYSGDEPYMNLLPDKKSFTLYADKKKMTTVNLKRKR